MIDGRDGATVTLKLSYEDEDEDNDLTENQASNTDVVIPERQAVNDAKEVVGRQKVILDRIDRFRWLLQRVKEIGDSIKEVSDGLV